MTQIINPIKPVAFSHVALTDPWWRRRLQVHAATTLPLCLDQCRRTGRISNFARAAGLEEGGFEGTYFNDSDVYKVLEGIAGQLAHQPDSALAVEADAIIDLIAAAQWPDGYLFTYYTLTDRSLRWTDMSMHEMYCAGHLIEAAVAYDLATGKDKLLQVACRLADHLCQTFGPGLRHWVPGHQEIELALVKLCRHTGRQQYLELADFLIRERGHGHGSGMTWQEPDWGTAYCQDDLPAEQLERVTGHAVRAMYYYTGIADVAAAMGNAAWVEALDRVWRHLTGKNIYITGGIGPSNTNEGFTSDYDLPNQTSYCETCASIGLVYWSSRMNLLHRQGHYLDVLETALYNGVLSGVSLDGDRFYYANPLASDGTRRRKPWFDCSCCPTSIARLIPSVGGYLYAVDEGRLWVNLYADATARIACESYTAQISQKTAYPWDGCVELQLNSVSGRLEQVLLRLPGWCRSYALTVNGKPQSAVLANGYLALSGNWQAGDTIKFDMAMPVEHLVAHPSVLADSGRTAIRRGPVVYCAEAIDQEKSLDTILIDGKMAFQWLPTPDEALSPGVLAGYSRSSAEQIRLIPYHAIDNREASAMAVWLPLQPDDPSDQPLYRTISRPMV